MRVMNKGTTTAVATPGGRASVTRISTARARTSTRNDLTRARQARRDLRPRTERFAHLKAMHD
jgi:hypothetical protein